MPGRTKPSRLGVAAVQFDGRERTVVALDLASVTSDAELGLVLKREVY